MIDFASNISTDPMPLDGWRGRDETLEKGLYGPCGDSCHFALKQDVDRMEGEADQPAHERAIDTDILKVTTNRVFNTFGDATGIPATDRI